MKVFIIAALTADGFIGRNSTHLSDWTSKEDKKLFVKLTKEAGVMIMGSRTFKTIGKALPDRRMVVLTSKPKEITAKEVEATNEPISKLLERLKKKGVNQIAVCGGSSVYKQFMHMRLVDELFLTYEPILFGNGITLFEGKMDTQLQLLSLETLNQSTYLAHYAVKK